MPLDGAPQPTPTPLPVPAEALGAAVQRGEAQAFHTLWQRERGRLTTLARRMTGSAEDADDVVQEAFLSAWRHHARFQGASLASTWLYRITANAALMHLRRRRRRPAERLESLSGELMAHIELGAALLMPTPEGLLLGQERQRQLLRALGSLPESERELVSEAYEDDDNEAVAARHRLSRGALKSRLYRSRQTLRVMLNAVM